MANHCLSLCLSHIAADDVSISKQDERRKTALMNELYSSAVAVNTTHGPSDCASELNKIFRTDQQ